MQGVDTRALTKRIREKGTMLGKLRIENKLQSNGVVEHRSQLAGVQHDRLPLDWQSTTEALDWFNPNIRNLVADGRDKIMNPVQYYI